MNKWNACKTTKTSTSTHTKQRFDFSFKPKRCGKISQFVPEIGFEILNLDF